MVQGGWTPPRHHAVLDDHLTKLYATAESQLQSYVAALAEGKRKAALLSDGKKMENGHPCVNFVFANNDGTRFCKNVDTFGHSKTAEWYAGEIKNIIEESLEMRPEITKNAVDYFSQKSKSTEDPYNEEEIKLMKKISEGLGNKEIASQESTTEGAIKQRLFKLFKKAQVRNRAEMVKIYLENIE